jgi:hypothetical protein
MKPTFLYIKRHTVTGLLYFGKTTKTDVDKYTGSGVRWTRHMNVHGRKVETLWYCLFTDQEALVEFATSFSKLHNIAESTEWANSIVENGLDGKPPGTKTPLEVREKISKSKRYLTDEQRKEREQTPSGSFWAMVKRERKTL